MKYRLALVALVAVMASACSEASPPLSPGRPAALRLPRVTRTDLGTLGGDSAQAKDINNLGVVAGWSLTASGDHHAFRWTREAGMLDLGIAAGAWSRIHVKDNGKILVDDVLWTPPGSVATLSIPPLPYAPWGTMIIDFNDAGQVLGSSFGSPTYPGCCMTWSWRPGDPVYDITSQAPSHAFDMVGVAINRSGLVVGNIEQNAYGAFTWSASGGFTDLGFPDRGERVDAMGMNDLGQVVGRAFVLSSYSVLSVPFLWSAGTGYRLLPTAGPKTEGPSEGEAHSINGSGTAVGQVWQPPHWLADGQAAAWPKGGSLVVLDTTAGSLAVASDDRGTIVGYSGSRAILWQLAEPGTGER